MRPEGPKKYFLETGPPRYLRVWMPPPPVPPSEGLDPPLQSNNRSQKFLLVSGRRIGFFRLGRQIRLLYNKALEICIKHEKEKSHSGPESWRDFWHILSSFISQFLDLIQGMFSFFIRPQGFSLKKMAFSRLSFFLRKSPEDNPGDKVPPGNLISQADHPNCSRHLDVTCKCDPYIYCA